MTEQLVGPRRADFLDQFRYIIIGSQLLNGHANAQGYNPRLHLQNASAKTPQELEKPSHTISGLFWTVGIAFGIAWLIHTSRGLLGRQISWFASFATTSAALLAALVLVGKRQIVGYVRRRTLEAIGEFVDHAQVWDGASAATLSLVQEVELVSRGYRISAPLPPVSRLEEQDQIRLCTRLRTVLSTRSLSLLRKYQKCTSDLQKWAVEVDLERYLDIYEVRRADIEDLSLCVDKDGEDALAPQPLKTIKSTLQRLHNARKVFLCSLLSMDANGRGEDVSKYRAVNAALSSLSVACLDFASELDAILSGDTRFSLPETPREPQTPGHQRVRAQLRKFTTLSQGIRELQAKVFLLREESDRALSASEDVAEIGSRLLEQYDAFGADLRNLMHEWEEGRSALAANINKHEQRMSLSPGGISISRSDTPNSLSGLTAVGSVSPAKALKGGSPADALEILNGERTEPTDGNCSDEELFEAVAMPRQRSMLPREERLAKMKEERQKQVVARERADATRHMVKELESVIKLRPRPRGLRTSL